MGVGTCGQARHEVLIVYRDLACAVGHIAIGGGPVLMGDYEGN